MMAAVLCMVHVIALLSPVWTGVASGGFTNDLTPEEQVFSTHSRLKRQSCGNGMFQCKSGQCVDSSATCDGVADCTDDSDETAELCSSSLCSGKAFTCAYGGCVNVNSRCDGKKDCADGSDEDDAICGEGETSDTLSSTGYACLLPPQPKNGRYVVTGCDNGNTSAVCRGIEGSEVKSPAILMFNCDSGYVMAGAESVLCFSEKLTPEPPTCKIVTCPSLDSSTTISTCKQNGETIDCYSGPLPLGTEATLSCRPYFNQFRDQGYDTIRCSPRGEWTPPPYFCTPVCGKRFLEEDNSTTEGDEVKTGEFPWMVAIYRDYKLACMGSLISEDKVISAANCFWDFENFMPQRKEIYKFAVGKRYKDWNIKEDELQVLDAKEIEINNIYEWITFDSNRDIALILLEKPAWLSLAVWPICMVWAPRPHYFNSSPRSGGETAVWGTTKDNATNIALRKIRPLNVKECLQLFPALRHPDKFCAGYDNGKKTELCMENIGSGIVFQHNDQWYLHGIFSVDNFPWDDYDCIHKSELMFTNLTNVYRFPSSKSCSKDAFKCDNDECVDTKSYCDGKLDCSDGSDENAIQCRREVTPSIVTRKESQCFLPHQPKNGQFVVDGCEEGDTSLVCLGVKGTPVQPSTTLVYSCRDNYFVDGLPVTHCINRRFVPQPPICKLVTCPSLKSKSVDATCSVNGRKVYCNIGASPVGTEATLTCKLAYQLVNEPGYDTIKCTESGQWKRPPYTCTPVCGTRNPDGDKFVSYGEEAKVAEFPWVVAVYRNNTKTYNMTHICGGTLVSDQLIVSAAHCFWDVTTHTQRPNELYKFAIGKYYRDWNIKERELQVRDAKDIILYEQYQDRVLNLASDIAVIILDEPVQLTWAVRPICIDWQNKYEEFSLAADSYGVVAGWGYTEDDNPGTVLMSAKLPFIHFKECWDRVPVRFRPFLTRDKFCAGYINGTSVRSGDSGGGLAFEINNLWYLRGIVSVGGADLKSDQYTAFTSVSKFLEFIKNYYP